MGDTTAQEQGRITLNPLAHIDPIGTVLLPLVMIFGGGGFLFGWAKPTPVNPRAFADARRGEIIVSGAGPASNAVLAVAFAVVLIVVLKLFGTGSAAFRFVLVGIQLNILLALFNLIPLPPLDGSHVAASALPPAMSERYRSLVGPWGSWILLLLVLSGLIGQVIGPLTMFFTRLLIAPVRALL